MSVTGAKYIVVENSGMVGEVDVAKFDSIGAASRWIAKTYSKQERDTMSPNCLHPEICVEIAGERSYEL
jgi:hypothetical protein